VIYAVAHPTALVGLLVGYLVGAVLRGAAQAVAGARLGAPEGRLRRRLHLRLHVDPFSAVAAALSGVGWAARAPLPTRRGSVAPAIGVAAVGLAVSLGLTAIGLAGFVAAGGSLSALPDLLISEGLHGSAIVPGSVLATMSLAFALENLGMALLTIVPMPPTETGRIVAGRLRSPGWRRAAYRLDEENWGVAVLLVLLLLPLGNRPPPLLALLDALGGGLFRLIGG
jgi:hypothetical protein